MDPKKNIVLMLHKCCNVDSKSYVVSCKPEKKALMIIKPIAFSPLAGKFPFFKSTRKNIIK